MEGIVQDLLLRFEGRGVLGRVRLSCKKYWGACLHFFRRLEFWLFSLFNGRAWDFRFCRVRKGLIWGFREFIVSVGEQAAVAILARAFLSPVLAHFVLKPADGNRRRFFRKAQFGWAWVWICLKWVLIDFLYFWISRGDFLNKNLGISVWPWGIVFVFELLRTLFELSATSPCHIFLFLRLRVVRRCLKS